MRALVVQAKAKCTNVPVQTDARRSQQKQDAKKRKQPETTNTQKHQTNPTKQETGHANKTNQSHEGGGATNTNQDNGQRDGQTRANEADAGDFFFVQRLHGFRQVVQHVQEHVAIGIN